MPFFRLLLFVILLLVAVGCIIAGNREVDAGGETSVIKFRRIGFIVLAVSGFFLLSACVRVVEPGHVGIPVTFGNVGSPLSPGVAFTNPFASVTEMSVRTEEYTMSATSSEGDKSGNDSIPVKGADGGDASVDATVLYRLDNDEASTVFRTIGGNYESKIVRPTSRTCIRAAFGDAPILVSATTGRDEVLNTIRDCLTEEFESRGLVLEEFQLRNVGLSEAMNTSIQNRLNAQQVAEQKVFELQSAAAEADKRRIDAQGVADAEQIIKCGATVEITTTDEGDEIEIVTPKEGEACEDNLTPEYLQYQYIQALKELVDSPNNSTLIIPNNMTIDPVAEVLPEVIPSE